MSEHSEKVCHVCEGSGEVVHPQDRHKHPHDDSRRMQDCRKCVGTGYVSAVRA